MSGYKHFAIAGAGNFGTIIAKELLKLKKGGSITQLLILTRAASKNPKLSELEKLGAKIVEVDYESSISTAKALSGVDVLICAFGPSAIPTQTPLADTAKDVGVKLFVPSEFGADTDQIYKIPGQAAKLDVQKKLKDIDLPYTLYQTGIWTDACFQPFFGFDFAKRKVVFGGRGDALITFTATDDAARFIAHSLVSFHTSKLERQSIRMEGDRQSFNAILSQYENIKGVKLNITRRSRKELEENAKKGDIFSMFFLAWDLGGCLLEDLANDEWPEWKPKTVLDVIL